VTNRSLGGLWVIRRTIATLGQTKGTVKSIQGVLRHSRAKTTTDVYMQEMAEGVRETVKAICEELRKESCTGSDPIVLTPNDTNQERRESASD
jgi:hypothetical protein